MTDSKDVAEALKPIAPPSKGGGNKRAGRGTPKSDSSDSPMTLPQLRTALVNSFSLLGMAVMGFDQFDGEILVEKSGDMADCLIEVAKTNKKFRARLEAMVGISAWGGVITVFGAQVALPIAVHHNLLPGPMNEYLAEVSDIDVKGAHLAAVQDLADNETTEKGSNP